ncbi:MAG: efflux RND transporter periplasmic adaptor subunit [Verrucomicrobiales bacterium]|nr:efflux RND transporter periplasmic adaptor subunit [Verrucomicrobiales bacterium]
MNNEQLNRLRIASERKRRPRGAVWLIFGGVAVLTAVIFWFAVPRAGDSVRTGLVSNKEAAKARADAELRDRAAVLSGGGTSAVRPSGSVSSNAPANPVVPAGAVDGSLLTVSGYIVNRERIEISPRFMGLVKWIGVKKGDAVTNGQVVVLLDTSEYEARLNEINGQIAVAEVAAEKARLDFRRAEELVRERVEMGKVLDDARLQVRSAEAQLQQLKGSRQLIETWIDWCTIRSPIRGVVLEKLVDPGELVSPQTFGGTRGPSTSLIAVADPQDLQIEIDLNESDLPKVFLGQKCVVSPEAFPEHRYDGVVAEMAPEASRQKGTLQLKVQVRNPDRFLTPELSAKVDFLPGK